VLLGKDTHLMSFIIHPSRSLPIDVCLQWQILERPMVSNVIYREMFSAVAEIGSMFGHLVVFAGEDRDTWRREQLLL
jgi:hypothetical protein